MASDNKLKKEYIGDLIILDFYRFKAYRIEDAKGRVLYNAEPVGETGAQGVTRAGNNLEEVRKQLVNDCKFINSLQEIEHRKRKAFMKSY